MEPEYRQELQGLFSEMVPPFGKAPFVAGEIVRAVSRIVYRWDNLGDRIGVDYGNRTCNHAALYVSKACGIGSTVAARVNHARTVCFESDVVYGKAVDEIVKAVVKHIRDNPHLRDQPNRNDMLSCGRKCDNDSLNYTCEENESFANCW